MRSLHGRFHEISRMFRNIASVEIVAWLTNKLEGTLSIIASVNYCFLTPSEGRSRNTATTALTSGSRSASMGNVVWS